MEARSAGRTLWREVVVIAALVGTAMPLSATTLIRAGLEDLTAANRTVVVGEVLETHSYWNADGTFILTDVRIAPMEFLKGERRRGELTVTLLGGSVGDLTTLIVGGAELVPGRPYVLFLNRESLPGVKGVLTVRDHSQGVFDIVNTADGLRAVSQARTALLPDSRGVSEPPGGAKGLQLKVMMDSIRSLAGVGEDQ